MSKRLPHFACYPGDFFSDPRFNRLPGEIRGTWCQLIMLMWHDGDRTRLQDNDEDIAFALSIPYEKWQLHRTALETFKLLQTDEVMHQIYNNRLEREYGIAECKCSTNAANAHARWARQRGQQAEEE